MEKTGDDGLALTFYPADTDQSGKPTGGFDKIRAAGTHDGNHISAKFKLEGFDGKGNPTFSATGTIDATVSWLSRSNFVASRVL